MKTIKMKMVYTLNVFDKLACALVLAMEFESETGVTPDYIELENGKRVAYNRKDSKFLFGGFMDEEEYIAKHQIVTDK